jgi:hypothetical protein
MLIPTIKKARNGSFLQNIIFNFNFGVPKQFEIIKYSRTGQ